MLQQRIVTLLNLAITGYYVYSLVLHVMRPGQNIGYTRMLMFACIATIPMVFMMAMVGGQDRWPALLRGLRELAQTSTTAFVLAGGVVFLLILMPLGMLVGVWFGMRLKFGTLFVLFFVPLLLRLALTSAQSSTNSAVHRAILLFGALFGSIALVYLLNTARVDLRPYEENVQAVWPGYGDAAVMFFAVWLFAVVHHLMEFRYGLVGLFSRG
jgi:hypothetical protein